VSRTYASRGFSLTLTAAVAPEGGSPTPVLRIAGRGAPPLELVGDQAYEDAAATVVVAQLDAANTSPQIIFETYSGGAHCCDNFVVSSLVRGRWRVQKLSCDCEMGHDLIVDPGRGRLAIGLPDKNFDYAFASHAGSIMPMRFYAFRSGSLWDVTSAREFLTLHAAEMARERTICLTGIEPGGGCAAYLAEASLVGEAAKAWAVVGKRNLPSADWSFPSGCEGDDTSHGCPKAEQIEFKSFAGAVRWFLWRHGYDPVAEPFACGRPHCLVPRPLTLPPLIPAA